MKCAVRTENGKEMGKEHRLFRRYNRTMTFSLSTGRTSIAAESIDYSVTGIRALVPGRPPGLDPSPPDLRVHLSLAGRPVTMKARIMWSEEVEKGLKIGIELMGPILGSLTHYRLSDLLIGLQRAKKEGTLEVKSGPLVKKIYLKDGDMVFAASNQEADRLGDMLLAEGKITQEQYDRSAELMRSKGIKRGAAFIELGSIKPRDLFLALKRQVEKIIVDLFRIPDGIFFFKEGPLPPDEIFKLNFSAANIIYRGIKNISDERFFHDIFPSHDKVFRLSPDPLDLFQDITLNDDDKSILGLIDGSNTIKNILSLTPLDNVEVFRTLYMFLASNIVLDMTEVAPDDFGDETDVVDAVIDDVGEQRVDLPEEFMKRINDLHDDLERASYYDLFGINADASRGEVKKAYYGLAKEFHPDRHFYLPEDMKGKLSAVFSHLTNAYSVLNDEEKREEYDKRLSGAPDRHVSGVEVALDKYESGQIMFTQGNYDEAAQLFAQAIYIDRSQAKYYFYYGLSLVKLDQLKEAEKEFRTVLKMEPENAKCLAEIGHVYLTLGLPLRAKRSFEKALKIDKGSTRALAGIAALPVDVR